MIFGVAQSRLAPRQGLFVTDHIFFQHDEFTVNQQWKEKLLKANINPYSTEGRSEIYCRFVLDYPGDKKNQVGFPARSIN